MLLRDHTFLGTTQSLCPECLSLVTAKIIVKDGGRVYFRKHCPTHGFREDFVCSDVRWYDRNEFSIPGKQPEFGIEADKGCPYDCGLCTEHEQHTCIGLLEMTSSCNLECPMCYAASGPGGKHLSYEECIRAIDRLVRAEGRPELLQLSGGEPTIHPEFFRVLEYAANQPIDYLMLNTNGVRLAHDEAFVAELARYRERLEIYLQFDGLSEDVYRTLRGEPLLDVKRRAVEMIGKYDLNAMLVVTLQPGVNDHQLGDLVRYGTERPWIAGLSLQPATYSGRHVLPEALERRITFPDVVREIERQTVGMFVESDFLPLPCAHPNCHTLAYAYRKHGRITPLSRFIDVKNNLSLLANGITFTRPEARARVEKYLRELACGGGCDVIIRPPDSPQASAGAASLESAGNGVVNEVAAEFFARVVAEELSPRDLFRITITSFLDAYNFDVRRLMKCCIHHVLPSGHIIPFCAYNVLYRDGHVPLPALKGVRDQLSIIKSDS
jgi:uncharacterized radical SAM superfamily Fe-S cluster-containing enzyme